MILYFHVSSIKAKYRHILFFSFFLWCTWKTPRKEKFLIPVTMATKLKMASQKVAAVTILDCSFDKIQNSFLPFFPFFPFQDLKQRFHYYLNHQKIQFHWHLNQGLPLKINQLSGFNLKWQPHWWQSFLLSY